MKALLTIFAASTLYVANAFAMPCDVSNTHYSCSSKNYKVELQFCGFDNSNMSADVQIKGKALANSTLGGIWNGTAFLGAQFLAEDANGAQRSVTMEVSQKSLSGTITEQNREMDPSPWKQTASEKISCKVSSEE